MFNRPHHQNIVRFLEKLDGDLLERAGCFFGGGTAIVLLTNEYRESVDVDFLCASAEGYRQIRELVSDNNLNKLAKEPIQLAREVRKDRDKIYTVIDAGPGERPIKFEIVREARISLEGQRVLGLPVAMVARDDLYAEKILANADRWPDASVLYRDAIDLAMMIDQWGPIPQTALEKTKAAYGNDALGSLRKVTDFLAANPSALDKALLSMAMDEHLSARITAVLESELHRIEPALHRLAAEPGQPEGVTALLTARGAATQRLDTERGHYVGPILLVEDDHAVQDLGRNTVAVHRLPASQPAPVVGQRYTVKYTFGHPDWEPKVPSPRRDLGR